MMQSLVYSVVRTNKATYKLIKEQEDRKKSLSCSSTTCSTPLVPCSPSVHKPAQPLALVKSGSKVHPWASINLAGQKDSSSDCSEVHEQDIAAVSPLTSLRLEVIEHLEDEEYEQDSVKVRGHGHGHGHGHGQLSNGSTKRPCEVLVSDLEDAVGHLKVVFESNICLSKLLKKFYFCLKHSPPTVIPSSSLLLHCFFYSFTFYLLFCILCLSYNIAYSTSMLTTLYVLRNLDILDYGVYEICLIICICCYSM